MPVIRAFRGLRYNPARIPDLSDVLAPPYDVIDAAEQERLYQVSAYNIVRLILGKSSPTDTPQNSWHARAARDFTAWRSEQILREDQTPALYLIAHTFDAGGETRCRLGCIALLELLQDLQRVVYRHEATLDAPKQDRARLLEAIPANLSPIFCVYPDPQAATQALLQQITHSPPLVTASMHGDTIRLWMITDPRTIEGITQVLSTAAVLIADGHHRFEVAYAKRDQYPALMSYFVSMEDPALVVQPIHRVIRQPLPMERLRRFCTIEPVRFRDLALLSQFLEAPEGQGRFGVWDGDQLYRVTLQPEPLARWLMAPSVPRPIATLDVLLLHQFLVPQLYDAAPTIDYTADASTALPRLNGKTDGSLWLLRPMPLSQVYALAAQGLTLPPKSTYFYPKVPSGLVLNPLASCTTAGGVGVR